VIQLTAFGLIVLSVLILLVILREEHLAHQGKVPLGRLRRFWLLKKERRRAPRYRVDWSVRYQRIGPKAEPLTPGRTRDLSETGVGLVVQERLEAGTLLLVTFTPPGSDAPLALIGRVAWSKEMIRQETEQSEQRSFFMGVHFEGVDPPLVEKLRKVLGSKAQEEDGRKPEL